MKTHDYTDRSWGHDYFILGVIDMGQELIAGGWGEGVQTGDHLILRNGEGSTRYLVKSIKYEYDPTDMWYATLKFAPR